MLQMIISQKIDDIRFHVQIASDRMRDCRYILARDDPYTKAWLYNSQRKRGRPTKLRKAREKPYRIIKKVCDLVH